MTSKYRRQFQEVSVCETDESDVDISDDDTSETTDVDGDDVDIIEDAISDELLSDDQIRRMGLGKLLSNALLTSPDKDIKCSLVSVECGRQRLEWTRGTIGLHLVVSPSSGTLVVLYTDRIKDSLRGSKRNGAVQKIVVQIGSLWSVWMDTTTTSGSCSHLNIALSSACTSMYDQDVQWK